MRMACDQRVDAVDARKSSTCVLHPRGGGLSTYARMRQGDHHIGPLSAQPWNVGYRRFKYIAAVQLESKHGAFPQRGLGRGKAHKAHPQRVYLPVLVRQMAGDDDTGGNKPDIVDRIRRKMVHQIG